MGEDLREWTATGMEVGSPEGLHRSLGRREIRVGEPGVRSRTRNLHLLPRQVQRGPAGAQKRLQRFPEPSLPCPPRPRGLMAGRRGPLR